MNRLILLLCLVMLASGCKSFKKSVSESDSTETHIQRNTLMDSSVATSSKTESTKEEIEELEEVIQSYVALDSAGITVFKPTTTTRRKNTSTKEMQKSADTTAINLVIEESESIDSTRQTNFNRAEEYEGHDIVKSVLSSLIPTWVKFLSLFIGVVITILISRKIIKKISNQSNHDQTTEQ